MASSASSLTAFEPSLCSASCRVFDIAIANVSGPTLTNAEDIAMEAASVNARDVSNEDLLNSRETASVVRLSVPTLERMRSQGNGPPFIKLGTGKRARVVYRRSDIEAWLSALRFQSTRDYIR